MSIDLPPLTAFALETSGGAVRIGAQARTLTLRPHEPAPDCSPEPQMSGMMVVDEGFSPGSEGLLRAAVLPAEGAGLHITF